MNQVTAIVPVWNGRDLLRPLFQSLRAQTHPVAEILVIDDGSQDGAAEVAEELGARVVRLEAHSGFSKTVNRGIRESRTPLVAILNNDVELPPDWLEKLEAALQPGLWFATGRILQASQPDRIDATFDAICRGGTACRIGHNLLDGSVFRQARRIWSAPFTAALFRAGLFERVGLLEERFESTLEDAEFGLRCALAGCAGMYVPDALAWHQGSATLGRWNAAFVRRVARNQILLVSKHYPARLLWRYAWPILIAQILWGLLALRHGRGWAWLRGTCEGFRHCLAMRHKPAAPKLPSILSEGERQIRCVQRQYGGDLYWKMYFLLTGGGAK